MLPDLTNIITAMRKTDAYHDPSEANDLLTAAAGEVERLRRVELAAGNLDRYSLVIESAVRNSDSGNSDGVVAAILRLRAAMGRDKHAN